MALPVVSAERQEGRSAAPWSNDRNLFASLGLNAAIVSLWLFWPVGEYLRLIFSRDDFRTSQWVLLAVVGLLAFKLYRRGNEGADKGVYVIVRRLSPRRLLILLTTPRASTVCRFCSSFCQPRATG